MDNSNTRFNQLKCSNCGSANFSQESDSMFKCAYCGTTIQIERGIKEQFISALSSRTRSNKNLHILLPTYTKDEFLKNTIINLGINPDTPEDILQAAFSPVQQNYNCYIVLETEFSTVKISGTATEPTQDDVDTNNTQTFYSCIKASGDKEDKTNRLMLEDVEELNTYETLPLTKENLNKIHYTLPDKKDIDKAIEDNLNEIQNNILKESKDKNIVVVHKVNKIDMYITPEYTVEYEYNGKKHKEFSFAYKASNQSDLPESKDGLTNKIKKTTTKCALPSILLSIASIIFAILHLAVLKTLELLFIDGILAISSLIMYFITRSISKSRVVKIKTKLFNQKRQRLFDHFKQNNLPELTMQDQENINNYIRWY